MKLFRNFESIRVGDEEHLVKVITESDIRRFVDLTGDDNPLHVDPAFAKKTSFKDIVVHGMLGASFISTVIGTKLPGPGALWIAQNLEFVFPVRLGDELTISCTVRKKNERERVLEIETQIVNQNLQTVVSGHGKVKVLSEARAAVPAEKSSRPRVAIVTGGSGGIGEAICRRLARDNFGVVINYLANRVAAERLVAELEAGGARAIAVQADVSTPAGAQALIRAAVEGLGGIDVLINNAAPRINPKPFAMLDWEDVQRHLDIQLKGAFLMAKLCIPLMAAQRYGRIVSITSQVLECSPSVTWTGYAVAKAALATLSHYLAAEFGSAEVTVNCVSPGMTDTPLIGDVPEKVQLMVSRQTPLRRLAVPDDIAAAVAYLISDGGSFVTGQTVRVNGGISVS